MNSYASGMANYIKPSLASPPSHIQDGFQDIVRPHPRCCCRQRAGSPAFEVRRCQHRRVWYVICFKRVERHLLIPADFGCVTDGTCNITQACPPLTQLGCKMTFRMMHPGFMFTNVCRCRWPWSDATLCQGRRLQPVPSPRCLAVSHVQSDDWCTQRDPIFQLQHARQRMFEYWCILSHRHP